MLRALVALATLTVTLAPRQGFAAEVWLFCTGTQFITESFVSPQSVPAPPETFFLDAKRGMVFSYNPRTRTLSQDGEAKFASEAVTWSYQVKTNGGTVSGSFSLDRRTLHLSGSVQIPIPNGSVDKSYDEDCSPTPPQPVQGNRI